MNIHSLTVISMLFLFFALFSKKVQKSIFTAPMIFTFFGLILGPDALNFVNMKLSNQVTRIIAELTLVFVLFSDASRIHLSKIIKDHNLPIRLLLIGLPVTFGFGWIIAYGLFPSFTFWEAALLSAILCPTDAALIHSVVSYPKVPVRIRQALNIESGLNDGLMVPIVIGLISYVSIAEKTLAFNEWVFLLFKQIFLGFLIGSFIGYIGGKLCYLGHINKWMNKIFEEISAVAIALLAYTLSEIMQGNGFIAAFVAGLTIGNFAKPICKCIHDFAAAEGQLLALLLFFFFGASFAGPILYQMTPQIIFYSILSLTLIRIIPVFLSLIGCNLRFDTKLYLGWFGPRGIASIVFSFLVIEKVPSAEGSLIFTVGCTTILLSIFLHGITAMLGAKWYAKKHSFRKNHKAESKPVTELPVRIPYLD